MDTKGQAAVEVAVDDRESAVETAEEREVKTQQKRFLNARGRVRTLKPLPVFDEFAVYEVFRQNGIKPLHAHTVWKAIIKGGAKRFDDIPRLPKEVYRVLNEHFAITTSTVKEAKTSANAKGATTKLIIELQDKQLVEAVIIRHEVQPKRGPANTPAANKAADSKTAAPAKPAGSGGSGGASAADAKSADAAAAAEATPSSGVVDDDESDDDTSAPASDTASRMSSASTVTAGPRSSRRRVTLCVSSQVGCAMACTFCATGTMGLRGNLTGGEICEQLYHAMQYEPIRNVVYMGMGEPLNNYDNVLASIRLMSNASFFALSPSKITVSTVGVVPKILALTREAPAVNLALSLHAPNQPLRTQIVPTARAWKLDVLMDSLDDHMQRNKKRVLIEYILLGGVNDSDAIAHELGALLKGRDVVCNLIPYNTVELDSGREYEAPNPERTKSFAAIVRTYGLVTTVRHEMGQEIGGACGQLAINGGKGCATDKPSAAAATAAAAKSADAKSTGGDASGAAAKIAIVSSTHTTAVIDTTDASADAVKAAAKTAAAVLAAASGSSAGAATATGSSGTATGKAAAGSTPSGDIEDLALKHLRADAARSGAAGATDVADDAAAAAAAAAAVVTTAVPVAARLRKKGAAAATAARVAAATERARAVEAQKAAAAEGGDGTTTATTTTTATRPAATAAATTPVAARGTSTTVIVVAFVMALLAALWLMRTRNADAGKSR